MSQASRIRVIVRATEGQDALVETLDQGCGRCHEEGGCGGQHLTQMFCGGPRTYRVNNAFGARRGDTVLVEVASGTLRHTATLAYVLPVAGLLAGALLGAALGGDAVAMLGGAGGLLAAWGGAAILGRHGAVHRPWQPTIISRL